MLVLLTGRVVPQEEETGEQLGARDATREEELGQTFRRHGAQLVALFKTNNDKVKRDVRIHVDLITDVYLRMVLLEYGQYKTGEGTCNYIDHFQQLHLSLSTRLE